MSSLTSIETLVSELLSLNGDLKISIHKVDVGKKEDIDQMFSEIDAQHGHRPDILISNAGYGKRVPQIWDISLEEFDYTINVNLRASFILVKGCVEYMREQRWGRIVFMSSIAAQGGGINGCRTPSYPFFLFFFLDDNRADDGIDYAASKGGMSGMMRNLSTRLAEYNISVNDVAPAMIGETGMIPNGAAFPGLAESIPLKRLGVPEEVANTVTMLVTTGYMTGQSLLLAGGLK
ncbi:hypothetical protein EIK77_008474 [Talaromyces pinophilus]|nr:hypothetical protein EIK77_008474 [Talaromyces pinophilus]